MSDWTELGVDLPTDEMEQNWREANEYTNEGEEPDTCPTCHNDPDACNCDGHFDGLPGLKFAGVPSVADIEEKLTGFTGSTSAIAQTVFNALRETLYQLAECLDAKEGGEHYQSRDARAVVKLSEGLWTEVEELLG